MAVLLRRDCHVPTYLQMLKLMIPRLNYLFENKNEVYFQKDGTPPYFHANWRNFLYRTLNQRWTGRRGSATDCSLLSPFLTHLDFYLWATLKSTVYARHFLFPILTNIPSLHVASGFPHFIPLGISNKKNLGLELYIFLLWYAQTKGIGFLQFPELRLLLYRYLV